MAFSVKRGWATQRFAESVRCDTQRHKSVLREGWKLNPIPVSFINVSRVMKRVRDCRSRLACVLLDASDIKERNLGGNKYECDNDRYHCVFCDGRNRGHCNGSLVVHEEPPHERAAVEVRA